MYFEAHKPPITARTPTARLAMVYSEKLKNSPFFRKECFSKANAEKVVKPPQKPVARKRVVLKESN